MPPLLLCLSLLFFFSRIVDDTQTENARYTRNLLWTLCNFTQRTRKQVRSLTVTVIVLVLVI